MLSHPSTSQIFNNEDQSGQVNNQLINNETFTHSYFETDINTTNQLLNQASFINSKAREIKNQKKKIFSIKKIIKKGRKKKGLKRIGTHTKFTNDNIYRKIKVKFLEKMLNYINFLLRKHAPNERRHLIKIRGQIASNADYEFNRDLLKKTLKEIFSTDIDAKYTIKKPNYNKCLIKSIYKKKIKSVTEVLNWTFLKGLQIFRDDNIIKKYKGFEGLSVVLEELDKNEDDEDNKNYIKKFENASKNFENYYGEKMILNDDFYNYLKMNNMEE